MATLVTTYGGRPVSAPSMREVPLASNPDALAFVDALLHHQFDIVILLTGVGTRALLDVVETKHSRDAFLAASLKLKADGAGTQSGEWAAAMRYFSGSTNTAYRFYGDNVVTLAEQYQNDIDQLNK